MPYKKDRVFKGKRRIRKRPGPKRQKRGGTPTPHPLEHR